MQKEARCAGTGLAEALARDARDPGLLERMVLGVSQDVRLSCLGVSRTGVTDVRSAHAPRIADEHSARRNRVLTEFTS